MVFTAVEICWAGTWAHEYTNLHAVSLRDVNSLTQSRYIYSGVQIPPPLDGNPVTVAVKCYKDNCHYVALIQIKCNLAQRAYEYNNM